ncbi:MAG: MepB family protein, partial [Chryseobacterium sp.]|nr:MepB family protein [Chryseobacterium sp.]
MINEIKKLDNLVFKPLNLNLSEIIPDPESEEYFGFNFKINDVKIKFRKSKLTPKKIGQFVTFWKRD